MECNCSKDQSSILFNEIIELPVVVIDVKACKVKSIFHTYVRLELEKEVTEFCTELTGITNEQVSADNVPSIKDALNQLHKFLSEEGIFQKEFIFLSCGDFDGNQLSRESEKKNFTLPNYLKRWINLKKVFPTADELKQKVLDSSKWTHLN